MHDITANLHMSEKKETEMANTLLDATTRSEIIEILLNKLRENYVFPNAAEEMEESMRRRLSGGEYNDITTGEAFAETLTVHLQEISKDKHLQVFLQFCSGACEEGRCNTFRNIQEFALASQKLWF